MYQQGWRLGGKGASGRNAALGQRIEEHGLHVWFGFYANAFSMMKAVYDGLARPPGTPLASWQDAFRQHDYVAITERIGAGWRIWDAVFPSLPGEPGTGGESLTPWQLGLAPGAWIRRWMEQLRKIAPPESQVVAGGEGALLPAWLHNLAGAAGA